MKLSTDDSYNLVSDLISRAEFDNRISKYKTKFANLITEEVLAHFIVDELGRNITQFTKLVELKPGTKASLFGIVCTPEPKLFSKKKDSREAAAITISDSTGTVRLLLWDTQHVNLVKNKTIKIGTKIKIINSKITNSSYGLDITPDRFESLIVNPPDFPVEDGMIGDSDIMDIVEVIDDGPVNVLGTIASKNQMRTFNRKDGSRGSVLNLELYDGTGKIRITLWDDHAKNANEFSIGDQLRIINGYSKLHNDIREIHTNYQTRISKE